MDLKFSVSGRISKPVEEVFEAVADPASLSGYFTTGGASGRVESGATVMWEFHDYPGAFPVKIVAVEPNRKIVFEWQANDTDPVDAADAPSPYDTTVTMTFEPIDDGRRTLVTIFEEGWRPTEAGRKSSYGNCMGWSQMLCAMKGWVEHGINLRDRMYN